MPMGFLQLATLHLKLADSTLELRLAKRRMTPRVSLGEHGSPSILEIFGTLGLQQELTRSPDKSRSWR